MVNLKNRYLSVVKSFQILTQIISRLFVKKAQHVRVDLAKISLIFVSSAWTAVLATESDMVDVVRDKLATFKTSFTCKRNIDSLAPAPYLNLLQPLFF